MHILLVEDDATIVHTLSSLLKDEGYDVISTATQSEAIELLEQQRFALALLDVTLKEGSGFAVCAAAKQLAPTLPIIFLTASDDEYSTVAGLDMGAVDYITKPFRARELLSRIRNAIQRSTGTNDILAAGNITLNTSSAQVKNNGHEIFLSALEYRLLLYFLQRKGKLVTRENLKDAIWDSAGEYVSDNALNVYIKRLREKIEDDPTNPRILLTVRGLGYKVAE